MPTHQVTNQVPPLVGMNAADVPAVADLLLRSGLPDDAIDEIRALGALAGTAEIIELGDRAEEELPLLDPPAAPVYGPELIKKLSRWETLTARWCKKEGLPNPLDAGEVEALRGEFDARAQKVESEQGAQTRLPALAVFELVKGLRGFEEIKPKDYDYVLEEAGFARQKDLDFDEFVEVSLFVAIVHMFLNDLLHS